MHILSSLRSYPQACPRPLASNVCPRPKQQSDDNSSARQAGTCQSSATRRQLLAGTTVLAAQALAAQQGCKANDNGAGHDFPDYSLPGPLQPARLPRLEHTCSSCFPLCVGQQCLLRLDTYFPKNGSQHGLPAPYPLAVFSGGFLVGGHRYVSYAQHLASWGYVCILYDKGETFNESLDDLVSVRFIKEIMDWASRHPIVSQIADVQHTYLCGHSRGGKLSVLAAAADSRVKAVACLDPVDNTKYAPLGVGYPSAVAALKIARPAGVPLALVGSGVGGDCVPPDANYRRVS